MKMKFLAPIFAMAMVAGCEDQNSSNTAVVNTSSSLDATSNKVQATKIIYKEPKSTVRSIPVGSSLSAEEKNKRNLEIRYPKVFSPEVVRECFLISSIYENNTDKQNDEVSDYFMMRAVLDSSQSQAANWLADQFEQIAHECGINNGTCALDAHDALANKRPACVSLYNKYVPK